MKNQDDGQTNEVLENLVDAWEEAIERGEAPDPVVLCQGFPDLLKPFLGQIEKLQRTEWIEKQVRGAIEPAKKLAPGMEIIPNYLLESPLGSGGFGTVWKALGPGGIHFALKFLWLGQEKSRQEWKSLAHLKTLHHPHLISIIGYWIQDGWLVIGNELADGTLADSLGGPNRTNGSKRKEILDHLRDAAEGIDYLHNQSPALVHGDIKPSNLFLLGGRCKVGDFGLVRRLTCVGDQITDGLSIPYAAPESILGHPVPASDQYSLGMTYCHLQGNPPFPGTGIELAQAHLAKSPDLSKFGVQEARVLAKCLAKKPEERFRSCKEMVHALNKAAADSGTDNSLTRGKRILAFCLAAILFLTMVVQAIQITTGKNQAIQSPPQNEENLSSIPENSPLIFNACKGILFSEETWAGNENTIYSISKGFIPKGLRLNSSTGMISGMPTEAGVFDFSVTAKGASFTETKSYRLSVRNPNHLPNQRPGSGTIFDSGSGTQAVNLFGFAALNTQGITYSWGNYGIGHLESPDKVVSTRFYSTGSAFAGLGRLGEVTAWGTWGGSGILGEHINASPPQEQGYLVISSNFFAFAGLKSDGSISVWGNKEQGGSGAPTAKGFKKIFSNFGSFAAIKDDGSISAWGDWGPRGGKGAPAGPGFVQIVPSFNAYTALREDGRVFSWGSEGDVGSPPPMAPSDSGYVFVVSTTGAPCGTQYIPRNGGCAFAGLKSNGQIKCWGDANNGGRGAPTDDGYVDLFSNGFAFAALKSDGSIVTWGNAEYGGNGGPLGAGYTGIFSTAYAFVALKKDGSLVAWGDPSNGGTGGPSGLGYIRVYSTRGAFAALHSSGSIFTWGNPESGGIQGPAESGFVQIFSNREAFAAMRKDGSIVSWGNPDFGGKGAPKDLGYLTIQSASIATPYFSPNLTSSFTVSKNQPLKIKSGAIGLDLIHTLATGSLPTGCILDAETGIISGTPERSGEFSFEIKAANATGSISRRMKMVVEP